MGIGERPETAPPKEDCIRLIMQRMAEGRWRQWLTDRELADQWGLAHSTVRNYAAEASRNLRIPKEEREAMIAQQAALLMAVMFDAKDRKSTITGLPDYRHFLVGWEMFQKYVLANTGQADKSQKDPAELSDEELSALAKMFARDLLSKKTSDNVEQRSD